MEPTLTAELVTAVIGGALSLGGAIAAAVRWVVKEARSEAAITRDSHEKQTQRLIEAQRERDAVQVELAKQREETVERRLQNLIDDNTADRRAFTQGLEDVRRSGETIVAMHRDYKQAHADLRQAFEDLRKWHNG